MRLPAALPLTLALAVLGIGRPAHAATYDPVAILTGNDLPLSWLQFTADGSRLASAGWTVAEGPKRPEYTGRILVRNLADMRLVTSISRSPAIGKIFRIWIAADGKPIVTDVGNACQIHDGATGKPLGDPIAPPPPKGTITAAAMSRDGKRFAVAWDAKVHIGPGNEGKMVSEVGTISVWDLGTRKERWRLPGTVDDRLRQADHPRRARSLAFAPGGGRLVVGSAEARMLTLREGPDAVNTPEVRAWTNYKTGTRLQWIDDGLAIVSIEGTRLFDEGTHLVFLDPANGQVKADHELPAPRKLPVPDRDNEERLRVPGQSALSSDGGRFAMHYVVNHEGMPITGGKTLRHNVFAVWDVATERLLGVGTLPQEHSTVEHPFLPGSFSERAQQDVNRAASSDVKIALSADGRRLATSDDRGSIRLFDLAAAPRPDALARPAGIRLSGEKESPQRRSLDAGARKFAGTTWDMIRITGTKVEPIYRVTLAADGSIRGSRHPNETWWAVHKPNLIFSSQTGEITTTFDEISFEDGKAKVFGKFSNGRFLHGLIEVRDGPARAAGVAGTVAARPPVTYPRPVDEPVARRSGASAAFVDGHNFEGTITWLGRARPTTLNVRGVKEDATHEFAKFSVLFDWGPGMPENFRMKLTGEREGPKVELEAAEYLSPVPKWAEYRGPRTGPPRTRGDDQPEIPEVPRFFHGTIEGNRFRGIWTSHHGSRGLFDLELKASP